MNIRRLALVGSCLLMPAFAVEPNTPKGHRLILCGQSNMTGQLEQGFRQKVEAKYGAEQVAIVRTLKCGRGIRERDLRVDAGGVRCNEWPLGALRAKLPQIATALDE